MKQYKVLQWAFSFLEKHNREPNVAEVLLRHLTNQSSTEWYANMQQPVTKETYESFQQFIKDHAKNGTPVQHIIGTAPFYGRDFYVNEHVLIPRFETEEVVYYAKEQIQRRNDLDSCIAVDLGTGSGVIAITLALQFPDLQMYATDLSSQALQIARKNARMHEADVSFLQGDFLQPLLDRSVNPDVIVSNPPYIAARDRHLLTDTVEKFDPALALFAENDGLAAYETIIAQIASLPDIPGRQVIFEIGYDQAKAVSSLLATTFPEAQVTVLQDINGQDRIVAAVL